MAAFALVNPYVSLASNDLTNYVRAVTLDVTVDEADTTNAGSSSWKTMVGSLKGGSISLTFNQDVAASALDSIMWPLLGTSVAFEIRATTSAVGTSNPKWTGSCIVTGWQPVAGSVGDTAQVSVSFPTTGTITRATS